MKATKWIAVALAAVVALSLVGCGGTGTTGSNSGSSDSGSGELSGSLTVQGSDTMVNLAQAWSEGFGAENSGVSISVTGGGSGTGIASLINGTVDFANASRQMKPEEIQQAKDAGVDPVETEVAKDGIVVLVNPANKVEDLTIEQLGKIYRGEITNWKDVGGDDKPIVLLGRDTSSGTYEFFGEAVVGKDAKYAKSMKNLQSSQAIVDEVGKNADAIGYVGLGYENANIKPLKVAGVEANVDTVLDKSYPLSRGLYMYSNGAADGAKKVYLDWILSAEGQKLVTDQGFVPLSK
ncbi:MAG TPA: PstS family phosphate ABC transporter substrate-binding protein [Coriobacteriia bacterium]|nr:PstS family phosphate ABC transporter substrate-binding protein [Coriobacteriia bacterium]